MSKGKMHEMRRTVFWNGFTKLRSYLLVREVPAFNPVFTVTFLREPEQGLECR